MRVKNSIVSKRVKEIRYCEVEGCNYNSKKYAIHYSKKYNITLCNKHYRQMKLYEKIIPDKIKEIKYCEVKGCERNSKTHMVYYRKKYDMILCGKHKHQLNNHGEITIKEIKYCEVHKCNRDSQNHRVCYRKQVNKILCEKHYKHIKKYGHIINRTICDPNEIIIYDDYAEILLYDRKGQEIARTKIDIEDIDKLKQYKWHFVQGYARTINKSKILSIHQILIGSYVDHIDNCPLNNRRSNLRQCSQHQNTFNTKMTKNNTSGIKGVYWSKQSSKWIASISINYKTICLGGFKNKREAAIVRLKAERKYFGEFQNKILEKQTMKIFDIQEGELN